MWTNSWNVIVNSRIHSWESGQRFLHFVRKIINLRNMPRYWNARTSHESVDQTSLGTVHAVARAVTTWNGACDRRLAGLMSHLTCTSGHRQCCHVANKASECKLGLFHVADVAGYLTDSKSTSGGMFCTSGDQTFVPISWACKKQTAVSHRVTEAEVISLDDGLRVEGLLA